MLEKITSQLHLGDGWKGRTMLLPLRVPLFNLVSESVQAADYQSASATFETKFFRYHPCMINKEKFEWH